MDKYFLEPKNCSYVLNSEVKAPEKISVFPYTKQEICEFLNAIVDAQYQGCDFPVVKFLYEPEPNPHGREKNIRLYLSHIIETERIYTLFFTDEYNLQVKCSNCNKVTPFRPSDKPSFCPECGSKIVSVN